jgi:hypothetical protein
LKLLFSGNISGEFHDVRGEANMLKGTRPLLLAAIMQLAAMP